MLNSQVLLSERITPSAPCFFSILLVDQELTDHPLFGGLSDRFLAAVSNIQMYINLRKYGYKYFDYSDLNLF
jgi:hypothetical protein